jgi:DNA-directed RNA polymerase specialized sigma24 family protein
MNETQQLLRGYVEDGSEAAFQELVGCYIDLVYSVARRQTGGDIHAAEDIAQTVFTDLARKAHSLPPNVMLGGWLHRHCCFVASTFGRGELRRQIREKEAVHMHAAGSAHQSTDPSWRKSSRSWMKRSGIWKQRIAMRSLFFFLNAEICAASATGSGQARTPRKKRVSRALEKLRHLLAERGVALSSAALGC